jgi:hypothetical protein
MTEILPFSYKSTSKVYLASPLKYYIQQQYGDKGITKLKKKLQMSMKTYCQQLKIIDTKYKIYKKIQSLQEIYSINTQH